MSSDDLLDNTGVKSVIGGLLNNATPAAQKALKAYNFNAKHKKNLDNMVKYDAKKELEPCAEYLGLKVRDGDKKLYKNKSVLCDRMILKIESLFDTHCNDCSETYRNTLDDQPPFECRLCMQGSHNCQILRDRKNFYESTHANIPGGCVWICSGCLKKNDLTLKASQKAETKPDEEVDDEETETGEEEDKDARGSPRRDKSENTGDSGKICEEYKKRKCPHGLTGKREIDGKACPDQHPQRCRRYCGYGNDKKRGCKHGKNCRFYHPRLCKNSLRNKMCLNKECTFTHLKETLRELPQTQDGDGDATERQRGPPLRPQSQRLRFSAASAYTPAPPTVENRQRQLSRGNENMNVDPTTENSFLLKLMESMKEGILSQVSDQMTELRTSIIKEVVAASTSSQRQMPVPLAHPYYGQQPNFPIHPSMVPMPIYPPSQPPASSF